MLDLRKRLFIIIGGVILIIILIFLAVFVLRDKTVDDGVVTPSTPSTTQDVVFPPTQKNLPPVQSQAQVAPVTDNEIYVRQLSRLFAERFLSYSNQNNNSHLGDVVSLVTPGMASWVKTQTVEQGSEYAGVTTGVISSAVKSISDSTATVTLGVQQQFQSSAGKSVQYKTGRVELVKETGEWKVSGFFWDETKTQE